MKEKNGVLMAVDKYLPAAQMLLLIAIVGMAVFLPDAQAQQWAEKTSSSLDTVIEGLKKLGIGIATMCIIWSAYQLIWGGKRLQDMVPFFIGACAFLAGPELVALFFGS